MGLTIAVSTGTGWTACPGPSVPFGGDDTGVLTCDRKALRCETKAAASVATMVDRLVTCHAKAARALFAGEPFDQKGCQARALAKFARETNTKRCPCVAKDVYAANVPVLFDDHSELVFCDSTGIPFGGTTTGFVPRDKRTLKCQLGIVACVPKLARDLLGCHQVAAKKFLANKAFDAEVCEHGPLGGASALERWNACVAKAQAEGGCLGCENPDRTFFVARFDIDLSNGFSFCTSPSGAFLDEN